MQEDLLKNEQPKPRHWVKNIAIPDNSITMVGINKKVWIALIIFLSILTRMYGQDATIIKTNVLNIPIIPSIHLEQQLNERVSIQFNFHRGHLVFFNERDWVNISLEAKRYFNVNVDRPLTGFYFSLAANHYLKYNEYINEVGAYENQTWLGAMGKIGGQWSIGASNFYIDSGMGLAYLFYNPKNIYKEPGFAQFRVNVSLGYKW